MGRLARGDFIHGPPADDRKIPLRAGHRCAVFGSAILEHEPIGRAIAGARFHHAMGSFYKDAGMRDICAQHSMPVDRTSQVRAERVH